MKKLFLLLTLFIFVGFGQETQIPPYDMEILPQTQAFDTNDFIIFKMMPVNVTAYCKNYYNTWYIESNPTSPMVTIQGNYLKPNGIPPNYRNYGFDACYSNRSGYPYFSLTLYKIVIVFDSNEFSFYLDMRDCSYGTYVPDITIRCIMENQVLRYYLSSGLNVNSNLTGFDEINQSDLFRINELINQTGNASTSCIENLWQNCLAVIPSQTGNHPRLVWGAYPTEQTVYRYKIYRKYNSENYLLIHTTTNNSTLQWTDASVTILNGPHSNETSAQYYVKAVLLPEAETEASNIVTVTRVPDYPAEKMFQSKEFIFDNFSLSQNHPNPFNPTTSIVYQIATAGNVNLSIYNLLGEKVAALVNDYKEAGEYTVQFNASGLPSGT